MRALNKFLLVESSPAADTLHSGTIFDQSDARRYPVSWILIGRKSLAVTCIIQRLMRLDIVSSKHYPHAILGFVAHLIKDFVWEDS